MMRLPDLRFEWMRRYNFSWLEMALCLGVGGGILAQLLTPDRVAAVVTLTDRAAAQTVPLLLGASTIAAVAVGYAALLWGPVRVAPATARWELSGPGSRAPRLARSLAACAAAVIASCLAASLLLGLLAPTLIPLAIACGLGGGVIATAVTYGGQALRGVRRRRLSSLSLNRLHRNTFAPRDGFAGAVGLAVSMMDVTWLADTRITRWQQRAVRVLTRPLPLSAPWALIRLDIRRLRRHPGTVVRVIAATLASIAISQLLVIYWGSALFLAGLGYTAGLSVAGGLRTVCEVPGIAKGFGVSDRFIRATHSVLPATAVLGYCSVVTPFWGLSAAQTIVAVLGIAGSVVWRATRPPLPFDAETYVDPASGAAIQVRLVRAQLRGADLFVATAILLSLL